MAGQFDIIVIGVGAMGSSTCFELARRGMRVLGLEQFDIPHARGSSHGQSRLIRIAYYEHADYVPLVRRALARWRELERLSGQKLLHAVGAIYLGPASGGLIAGSLRSARQHHLAHELLDHRQLADRYPQFDLPDDFVGFLDRDGGLLLPEKCVASYAAMALRHGAEIHGNEPVESWSSDASGATVRTSGGEYRADRLIFCGGPWTSKLLRDELKIELVVTRQVQAWVWPKEPGLFELGRLPVWAIDNPDGSLHYGVPMIPDAPGFKIAHHKPGAATDPDRVARDPLPGDEQTIRPALRRFIPKADGLLLALRVCLYTNSPDHHFILDRLPGHHDRVTIACGFSGHGFKFASVVGEVLADLAMRGHTDLPVEFLGHKRFAAANAE